MIFHPGIGGLVLKVENENDFHPWSPVNCAGANIQPRIKERCCSNGHECRADGADQIQGLIFTTTKTSQNFSAVLLPSGSLLKIDAAFTFGIWHQKKNFLFLGGHGESKQASRRGKGGTKWIASGQNIPFSTPLGLPRSLDSVVLFCHFT